MKINKLIQDTECKIQDIYKVQNLYFVIDNMETSTLFLHKIFKLKP